MREELVRESVDYSQILKSITTSDLWSEIARRINVKFGKIQVAIHEGRPSKFANIDLRVSTDEKLK